jgi:hypothetical protein
MYVNSNPLAGSSLNDIGRPLADASQQQIKTTRLDLTPVCSHICAERGIRQVMNGDRPNTLFDRYYYRTTSFSEIYI